MFHFLTASETGRTMFVAGCKPLQFSKCDRNSTRLYQATLWLWYSDGIWMCRLLRRCTLSLSPLTAMVIDLDDDRILCFWQVPKKNTGACVLGISVVLRLAADSFGYCVERQWDSEVGNRKIIWIRLVWGWLEVWFRAMHTTRTYILFGCQASTNIAQKPWEIYNI